MMIDPKHECSAVIRPEISLHEEVLWTDGVGLPVLLDAIALPDAVWFSTVVGEYDDEMRIIATDSPGIRSDMASSRSIEGEVTRLIGDRRPVTEYELTQDVAARFGIRDLVRLEISDFKAERGWLIASHDEHWSAVYPVGYTQLRQIVEGVLGQISFAIGREVPSGGVADALTELLHSYSTVRLDARQAVQAEDNLIEVEAMLPAESWNWLQRAVGKLGVRPFMGIGSVHTTGETTSIIINRKRS